MTTPNPIRVAQSRLALATRYGREDEATEARRDLHAAKLERAIREAIAAAPPLSDDQRARLSLLLASGGTSK